MTDKPETEPEAELCQECGFTFYNHIGNVGNVYPCWTPSGRFSHDKRINGPATKLTERDMDKLAEIVGVPKSWEKMVCGAIGDGYMCGLPPDHSCAHVAFLGPAKIAHCWLTPEPQQDKL